MEDYPESWQYQVVFVGGLIAYWFIGLFLLINGHAFIERHVSGNMAGLFGLVCFALFQIGFMSFPRVIDLFPERWFPRKIKGL